jgi:hypothetical protein
MFCWPCFIVHQYNENAFFIHFIKIQGPLHISSITCSSSGVAAQMAFGILRAYNVSWLWHGCSFTSLDYQ